MPIGSFAKTFFGAFLIRAKILKDSCAEQGWTRQGILCKSQDGAIGET